MTESGAGFRLMDVAWRPPRLETDRLVLRGREPADVEGIFRYSSDVDVTQYMAWDRARDLEDVWDFLDGLTAHNYEQEELDYGLALRSAPETLIGGVGVYWHPRKHRVMELGYVLAKEHWGQGYVPEAARALIRYAFRTTKVERIYAPIFAENTKSRSAAEKMGLRLEGVLRSAVEFRGRRWDEAVYSILRGESELAGRRSEAEAGGERQGSDGHAPGDRHPSPP
jgi:RimJ/RimL family protein N-acetyltransferase